MNKKIIIRGLGFYGQIPEISSYQITSRHPSNIPVKVTNRDQEIGFGREKTSFSVELYKRVTIEPNVLYYIYNEVSIIQIPS